MTKEDFIKKYIYGIGNDALTDNQEAIDMAKDLDRYFTYKLHQHFVSQQRELLLDFAKYMNKFTPSPNLEESEIDDYLKQKSKNYSKMK